MKQIQTSNFHSTQAALLKNPPATAHERLTGGDGSLSLQEDFGGISFLPRRKIEKIHAEKKLSPRSIKRKVNTFIEEKVLNSQHKAAIMFEELCK